MIMISKIQNNNIQKIACGIVINLSLRDPRGDTGNVQHNCNVRHATVGHISHISQHRYKVCTAIIIFLTKFHARFRSFEYVLRRIQTRIPLADKIHDSPSKRQRRDSIPYKQIYIYIYIYIYKHIYVHLCGDSKQ